MNNYNFVPTWYEKIQREKRIKTLKKFTIIIAFIDIILLDVFYYGQQKIKFINEEMNKLNVTKEAKGKEKIIKPKGINTIETINKLYNCPFIYNRCNWIKIKDKDVDAEIKIENNQDYYNLIKFLEDNKDFKINYISPIENKIVKLSIHFK